MVRILAAMVVGIWLGLTGTARAAPVFVLGSDPHVQHGRALVQAALKAARFPASFTNAPASNEQRSLYMLKHGFTQVDIEPVTPTRLALAAKGSIRMIPIPIDRGLLGYRINLLLDTRRDLLAKVRNAADLSEFTIGQAERWTDLDIYRAAGITTKEVKAWQQGQFTAQLEAGFIDVFPLGLEETLSYFLPRFQERYPQLTTDPHTLVRYPWFRFVWVSARPETDALYAALLKGFDTIARDGTFLTIWQQHRRTPPASIFANRTVIELENPFYGNDIVPARYQHLLFRRPAASGSSSRKAAHAPVP